MLCRQVEEAVRDALAAVDDDVLLDVWVVTVRPAPSGGPLVVVVSGARDAAPGEVLARLARVAGELRAEVASAVTRKRVPLLAFEVVPESSSEEVEP